MTLMETHEYAPGRTILSEDGDTYHVQDTLLGGSGNDWLIVTTDRLDASTSTLLQAGHVRETFFPVEPEEPVSNTPADQARELAERKANERKKQDETEKARQKALKKAKSKKGGGKKSTAKKSPAKAKPTAAKRTAQPRTGQEATASVPGPAAVSK